MPTHYTLHVTTPLHVCALYALMRQEHPDAFVYLCKDGTDVRQMMPDFENKKGLLDHPFHVVASLNRHPKDPPTIDDIAGADSIAASAHTTYLYMPSGLSFTRTLLQTRCELPVMFPLDPLVDDPPAQPEENPKAFTMRIPHKILQEAVVRAVVKRHLQEMLEGSVRSTLHEEVHKIVTPGAVRALVEKYLQEKTTSIVAQLVASEREKLVDGVQRYIGRIVSDQLHILAEDGLKKLVHEYYASKRDEIIAKLNGMSF